MRATTIVRLHGHIVGGGVVLAAACDLRVAAEDAIFPIPEIELGIARSLIQNRFKPGAITRRAA